MNQPKQLSETPWLSIESAALALGVSKPTVYNWVKSGRLESQRVGRGISVKIDGLNPSTIQDKLNQKSEKTQEHIIQNPIVGWLNSIVLELSRLDFYTTEKYKIWKAHYRWIRSEQTLDENALQQLYIKQSAWIALVKHAFNDNSQTPFLDLPGGNTPHETSWVKQESKHLPDEVGKVFQDFFGQTERYAFGQYFTPTRLADIAISNSVIEKEGGNKNELTILDNACGIGAFLVAAVLKWKETSLNIYGFDIDPCCAITTKIILHHIASREKLRNININVFASDAVVKCNDPGILFQDTQKQVPHWPSPSGIKSCDNSTVPDGCRIIVDGWRFINSKIDADIVLGNPPWLQWDAIDPEYRAKMASQWRDSTLFIQRGWASKVAAGKTDISSLFVYAAANTQSKQNAAMAFVLPIALIQGRRSGESFRRFETSEGVTYPLMAIYDMSSVKAFTDAVNRPCICVFKKGHKRQYPIPYYDAIDGSSDEVEFAQLQGKPLGDDATGPIVKITSATKAYLNAASPSEYRARGGINTGGGNAILFAKVIDESSDTYTIENIGFTRHSECKVVRGVVEKQFVYPLLGGPDVNRWEATPSQYVVCAHDTTYDKVPVPEDILRSIAPKTFSYLEKFKEELSARKEYHRWGATGPYYALYRIGPYTFSKHKVVWQHTGFRDRLKSCVISHDKGPLWMPDQKIILISTNSSQESHYICAILNSKRTATVLKSYLGIDASTHIMDFAGVKEFNPANPKHAQLAKLSHHAHKSVGNPDETRRTEKDIDDIVDSL